MIGTLRRHSTILWIIIIGATIVGLVTVFRPSGNFNNAGGGSYNYGTIDGARITQDDYLQARKEVFLRLLLSYGPNVDPRKLGIDEERELYGRLFLLKKLQEYDIHVDDQSVARAAANILAGFGRQTPVTLDQFVQQLLQPRNITEADFETFLRHDLAVEQLFMIVGLGGELVTPQEAQSLYQLQHQELATEAVFFSASNYLASVPQVTTQAVAQYYELHQADYRIPDRAQVSYVAFPITNFVPQAEKQLTNLNELVESNMRDLSTNYVRFGKTPAEAKDKIRAELIRRQAIADAQQRANKFANDLFNVDPVQVSNLARVAQTNGLTVHVSKPFDEENGPTEFDGGPNFAKVAFALTTNQPFAEQPVTGEDAVYVVALDRKIPSTIPPLNQIRNRVVEDYRQYEATLLARVAGTSFAQAVTNGIAQKKTFAGICAEHKIKPETVPPFSMVGGNLSDVEPHVSAAQYKEVAFETLPGQASRLSPTRDGAFMVYVRQVLPLDEAAIKAGLPAMIKDLRRSRSQEAINYWFSREAGQALRDIPALERKGSSAGESD